MRIMDYEADDIKTVCFLIRHHDDFISWVLSEDDYDRENQYLVEINAGSLSKHIESIREKNELPDKLYTLGLWEEQLMLCRADILSQAEIVYMNGKLVDSKNRKLKTIDMLMLLLDTIDFQW